jgi:hypothetical protein
LIIIWNSWGIWNKPQFFPEPWLEDAIIPKPIKMDMVDACKKMQVARYTELFYNCALRHPLRPIGQPYDSHLYYIFEVADLGNTSPLV